ncbi:MAG: hypothetical protein AAFU65_10740 [Pseudomonadota bacterium]
MTMLRTLLITFLFGLCASAQSSSPVASDLVGDWQGRSATGVTTQLDIRANGRFILRQLHSADLRRDYLCGTISDAGDTIVLNVDTKKERFENGDIEQMIGEETVVLPVHRRTGRTLILDYKSRTVVLSIG